MSETTSIRGIIYDMDGTLTRPYIDWPRLRSEMEIPEGMQILEYLNTLTQEERERKEEILLAYEQEAALNSELNPGVKETMQEIRSRGILQAVATNNSLQSVDTVFSMHGIEVDILVTREDGQPKPAGDLLLKAAELMGFRAADTVYVGDSRYDIQAAEDADIRFILLASTPNHPEYPETIHSFNELLVIINH